MNSLVPTFSVSLFPACFRVCLFVCVRMCFSEIWSNARVNVTGSTHTHTHSLYHTSPLVSHPSLFLTQSFMTCLLRSFYGRFFLVRVRNCHTPTFISYPFPSGIVITLSFVSVTFFWELFYQKWRKRCLVRHVDKKTEKVLCHGEIIWSWNLFNLIRCCLLSFIPLSLPSSGSALSGESSPVSSPATSHSSPVTTPKRGSLGPLLGQNRGRSVPSTPPVVTIAPTKTSNGLWRADGRQVRCHSSRCHTSGCFAPVWDKMSAVFSLCICTFCSPVTPVSSFLSALPRLSPSCCLSTDEWSVALSLLYLSCCCCCSLH